MSLSLVFLGRVFHQIMELELDPLEPSFIQYAKFVM
jgi:hypothetical protein